VDAAGVSDYGRTVPKLVARLLVLVAMLLMPLGMASAPAAAQHHAAMAMDMQHCPDPAPVHKDKGGIAVCTMACASALPALDVAQREPVAPREELVAVHAVQALDGLHPETATPPPKLG
jgi:hypothetical protein